MPQQTPHTLSLENLIIFAHLFGATRCTEMTYSSLMPCLKQKSYLVKCFIHFIPYTILLLLLVKGVSTSNTGVSVSSMQNVTYRNMQRGCQKMRVVERTDNDGPQSKILRWILHLRGDDIMVHCVITCKLPPSCLRMHFPSRPRHFLFLEIFCHSFHFPIL